MNMLRIIYNYLSVKYLCLGWAVIPAEDHAGNDHLHNLDGGGQSKQDLRDQSHEEEEEFSYEQELF